MKRDGVSVAFEMILEEIEAVEAQLNTEGACSDFFMGLTSILFNRPSAATPEWRVNRD